MNTHIPRILFVLCLALFYGNTANAQPGFLITDFGNQGVAVIDAEGEFDILTDLVILKNGDIVAIGESRINNIAEDYIVVKVNSFGIPVQSFGSNGLVKGNFDKMTDSPVALAINENEEIYIAVQAYSPELGMKADFIVKYFSNGQIDTTFADAGIFYIEGSTGGWNLTAVAVAPGGSIFGFAEGSDSISIFKLHENGTLDSSFARLGLLRLTKGNGGFYRVLDIKFQKDFKVVLAGFKSTAGIEQKFFVMRMDGNGKIDSTFAENGFILDDLFGENKTYAHDLAIQPDGKLLIGGGLNDGQRTEAILLRYNKDGTLDQSYGNNGYFKSHVYESRFRSVLTGDGDWCIAGGDYAIMKFLSGGQLDPNFGNISTGTTGSFDLTISKLDLDQNGDIVAIGSFDSKFGISKFEFGQSTSVEANADFLVTWMYPNPAQDHIHIAYRLDHPQKVKIDLLNSFGIVVTRLDTEEIKNEGDHRERLFFDPHLSPGIYFIRVRGAKEEGVVKMMKY